MPEESDQTADPETWAPEERALLDAALGFYDAAEGVIDFGGEAERPQVRRDAAGFDAVRRAMATIEDRVRDAGAAGIATDRIAELARIEREIVELILQRDGAAAPSPRAEDGRCSLPDCCEGYETTT